MPQARLRDTDSLIHLRVPAATKGRWIRASRAEGMRLTDWIIRNVEAAMPKLTRVIIPDDVDFADLKLTRDPASGDVAFDWGPIERICDASGIDIAMMRDAHESAVSGLIARWYIEHLRTGGQRDPIQDDLTAEVVAEDAHGGGLSHQPGRA